MSDSSGNWPKWMGEVANWITENVVEPIVAAVSSVKQHIQNNVIKHNVPLYDQGDHNLCWAYCQVMVESYNSGKNLSQKEADLRAKEIACEVNGSDNWDTGGWPTNLGREVGIDSIQALYDAVSQNGPVYAYYYNNKTGKDSRAHLVLVTGVNLISGKVYTNNPWGVKGRQTYKSFQKGVAKRWYSSGQGMTFQCIYLITN